MRLSIGSKVGVVSLSTLGAGAAGTAAGNLVEPLSNGLVLTMTADQVIGRFGRPITDTRSVGGGFGYGEFGLTYNARGTELWHLVINGPDVRLSSGITVGSARGDVARVFGEADHVVYDQYDLEFQYGAGDRVSRIRINPAHGSFGNAGVAPAPPLPPPRTIEPRAAEPRRLEATDKDERPFPLSDPAENDALFRRGCVPDELLGSWMSKGTSRIDIHPDGTYTSPTGAHGEVRANGRHIIFTGPLAPWNHGRAFWAQGAIQFDWRGANGIQYFAFVRVR